MTSCYLVCYEFLGRWGSETTNACSVRQAVNNVRYRVAGRMPGFRVTVVREV